MEEGQFTEGGIVLNGKGKQTLLDAMDRAFPKYKVTISIK